MRSSIKALFVCIAVVGCADDGFDVNNSNNANNANNENNANNANNFNNANNANNVNSQNSNNTNNIFIPEVEEEFEFSAPAVVGNRVFVANETLNTVAVINSDILTVTTVPVGFRPTEIVGPSNGEGGQVWVLNEGSDTVTRIDPETLDTQTFRSFQNGNALRASPNGDWAFIWFDLDRVDEVVPPQIDLASVTAMSEAGPVRLATGFNVRDVRFSDDDRYALIFTDDGISRLELATLQTDQIVPPVAILDADPDDLEILVDPTGTWAIGRADTFQGLVSVNLDTGEESRLNLPEIPTDIDWVSGNRVLVSLPRTGLHFVASVPDGFEALADAIDAITPPEMDMGGSDMGSSDMGGDLGSADLGMSDMGSLDAAGLDMGSDAATDTGVDMDPPVDATPLPSVAGVTPITLEVDRLGAAEVSPTGNVALYFSTLNDERSAVLVDLNDFTQKRLEFEKGVAGASADTGGRTFVVFHSKEDGVIPAGSTPLDPEYIARSFAISLVDVVSGANRLILTPHEAGRSALWEEDDFSKLYLGFRIPDDETKREETMKQIVVANLKTFATDTIQISRFPEGFGVIENARRVFVSQIHEQGRLTFIDVDTDQRQTVTGYQLNAGID